MDITVGLSSQKLLQQSLGFLSKCMTGFLVQRMSSCLYQSHAITTYEAQVITSQPTDMQKASRLIGIVIKKGQSACSSFLRCLGICDPVLYENVTGFPAKFSYEDHQHLEEIRTEIPSSEKLQFTPCIINIQNSSLTNCIIGNNNSQCITCDQQSLLAPNDAINEESHTHPGWLVGDEKTNGQPIPERYIKSDNSIRMERSNIEYVIIGDRNCMTVMESYNSEVEENIETESDVIG